MPGIFSMLPRARRRALSSSSSTIGTVPEGSPQLAHKLPDAPSLVYTRNSKISNSLAPVTCVHDAGHAAVPGVHSSDERLAFFAVEVQVDDDGRNFPDVEQLESRRNVVRR